MPILPTVPNLSPYIDLAILAALILAGVTGTWWLGVLGGAVGAAYYGGKAINAYQAKP